jgi:hypothetical protein
MLTRELALQRLRTAGTLAATPRPTNAITRKAARNETVRAVAQVLAADPLRSGPRCLAPAANHGVLP